MQLLQPNYSINNMPDRRNPIYHSTTYFVSLKEAEERIQDYLESEIADLFVKYERDEISKEEFINLSRRAIKSASALSRKVAQGATRYQSAGPPARQLRKTLKKTHKVVLI